MSWIPCDGNRPVTWQFVGLTRLQLDEIGRERQVQRQGAQRAQARAELSVELAQARILPAYELGR